MSKKTQATINDVAKYAQVAVGTVSRYLNGIKIKDSNRIAIEKAINELDYKANPIARSLKSMKSYTIGFIFPSVTDQFAAQIMDASEEVLASSNYSSVITGSRNNIENERTRVEFFNNKRVDGLIIMPISDESAANIELIDEDIPFVVIDKKIDGLNLSYITCDNRSGSYQGVMKLISAGHTRIGLIAGEENVYTSKKRKQGYYDALHDAGIKIDKELIQHDVYGRGGGTQSIKKLMALDNPPTAIFTTNFEITMSVIKFFMTNKFVIGEDVSLLGYDNIDMFQMIQPTIDTIEQPMYDIGRKAADLLLEKIDNPSKETNYSVEFETRQVKGASIKQLKKEVD